MTLASDVSDLESALATVSATAYKPAHIVALLDTAIATPIVQAGQVYASYSIGGRTVSMAIRDALELRKYYDQLAKMESNNGGIVPAYAEFREAR